MKYQDEEARLAAAANPEREYVERILPDKIRLARDYVERWSLTLDPVVGVKALCEAVGLRVATVAGGVLRHRRVIIVAIHLTLVAVSNYAAFWLRFDGVIPALEQQMMLRALPWLVAVRGLVFIPFRLYQGLWVYTSLWDLQRMIAGVGLSSALFIVVVRWGLDDAAELMVRDMSCSDRYEAVGFVDDDPAKVGQRIHGLPVLGTCADRPGIMANYRPHEVLIAMPAARPAMIRDLVSAFESYKVPITTLPNLNDLVGRGVTVSDVRTLAQPTH